MTDQPDLCRYVRVGAAWSLLGSAGTALGQLLLFAAAGHHFTLSSFGAFVLAWAFVQGGAVLLEAGLPPATLRAVGGMGAERAGLRDVLLIAVGVPTALGALMLLLVLSPAGRRVGASLLTDAGFDQSVAVLVVLVAIVRALERIFSDLARGLLDMRSSVVLNGTVPALAMSAALVILPLETLDLLGVLRVWFGITAVGVTIVAAVVWRTASTPVDVPSLRGATRALVRDAAPLWVSRTSSIVYGYADVWLVALLAGTAEAAGAYGAATRLAAAALMPFTVASRLVDPLIVRFRAKGRRAELERLLRTMSGVATTLTAGFLLLYVLLGELILEVGFEQRAPAALRTLLIATAGTLVHVSFGACGSVLALSGQGQRHGLISLLSVPLVVGLGFGTRAIGLAPAEAVAMAAALSLTVQNVLMWRSSRARVGLDTRAAVPTRSALRHVMRSLSHEGSVMPGPR